jgi:flagellar basal-body rod modification protein FlgD
MDANTLLNSGSTVNSGTLNAAAASAAPGASKTGSAAAQTQLSSDINFFLKLLTTQLKNQDPSSPLDTNQFTQQIAQYSSVQQQVNTNTNLEKLLAANNRSTTSNAVSYIGREVETAGNTSELARGQAAFSYILPTSAASAEITLTNAAGQVVFKGQGDTKAGRNLVVWDGVNSANGAREAEGTYKISVVALDAANKVVQAETRKIAIVSGVETDATGNTLLSTGRSTVNFNDVLAVRTPTRADL